MRVLAVVLADGAATAVLRASESGLAPAEQLHAHALGHGARQRRPCRPHRCIYFLCT